VIELHYTGGWWYHAGQADARRLAGADQVVLPSAAAGPLVWRPLASWAELIGRDALALHGYLPECVEILSPHGLAVPVIGTGPDGLPAALRAALPPPPDPRTPAEHVADLRATLHAARRARRQAAINAGAPLGDGRLLQSDAESRSLIQGALTLALAAMISGDPAQIEVFSASLGAGWRATDGSVCATDAAGMLALGRSLAAHIATCDQVSEVHRAAIDGADQDDGAGGTDWAATLAALEALDITTGWPA
jgi:hypothetical protein